MKSIVSIVLVALMGLSALAQDTHLDLTGAKPGVYKLVISTTGEVSVVPLKVVKIGEQPTPPPTEPNLPAFEEGVKAATTTVLNNGGSKTTGAAISSVYSLASSGVSDGSISLTNWSKFVKAGTDAVVSAQEDGNKWTTFRTEIGKTLTTLSAEGELDTKAEVSAVLKSIANGMNSATGFKGSPAETAKLDPSKAGILEGIDLAKVIELIKLIMELMKLFK